MKNVFQKRSLRAFLMAIVGCIILSLSGCGSSNEDTSEGLSGNKTTSNFLDGVASSYEKTSVRVDTDDVLSDYYEKGFDYVYLESHDLTAPSNGVLGDIGTQDQVHMRATFVDENNLYYVTEEISAIYVYWGSEIGWKNNYDVGEILDYDLTGFNGTYWKAINSEETGLYYEAQEILEEEMPDVDEETAIVEIYYSFANFDILQADVKSALDYEEVIINQFYSSDVIGTVMVVINGVTYTDEIAVKGETGFPTYLYLTGGSQLYLTNNSVSPTKLIYSPEKTDASSILGGYTYITLISKEEYMEASEGAVAITTEAQTSEEVEIPEDIESEENEVASSGSGEYEEDVYSEALEYHNLDFETIRNIVTIYVYDEEYVSTLDDVDIYYAFENAIGDQHIMIDMGTRDLYYDTETEIDEIREFLWSSEVSIITKEEAEGLDDYDAVGLYGVMCQYVDRLYAE